MILSAASTGGDEPDIVRTPTPDAVEPDSQEDRGPEPNLEQLISPIGGNLNLSMFQCWNECGLLRN